MIELNGKNYYHRLEAIEEIQELIMDSEEAEQEELDVVKSMTNKELEGELCLSGVVHDGYMGGVLEDSAFKKLLINK